MRVLNNKEVEVTVIIMSEKKHERKPKAIKTIKIGREVSIPIERGDKIVLN